MKRKKNESMSKYLENQLQVVTAQGDVKCKGCYLDPHTYWNIFDNANIVLEP